MAKITPVPEHIGIDLTVNEATELILSLRTLADFMNDQYKDVGIPDQIATFTQMLAGAVEALTTQEDGDAGEVDGEAAAA